MKWLVDDRYRDAAMLVLRVGIGLLFLYHGTPKLLGGTELWTKIGGAMGVFGIGFWHPFWGLMAALAEFGGGLALVGGVLLRPVMPFLAFTMIVAISTKFAGGDGIFGAAYPFAMLTAIVALFIAGPGRYSVDWILATKLGRTKAS